MLKSLLAAVLVSFLAQPAFAAPVGSVCSAGDRETECLIEAVWGAALVLPEGKQNRLKRPILDLVATADDPLLLDKWEKRFGMRAETPPPPQEVWSEKQIDGVLAASGWEGLIGKARSGTPPFNFGRPELLAAAVRRAPDAVMQQRLIDVMFDLAKPKPTRGGMGDTYEMSDFGHQLAELSMQRCNLEDFDRAMTLISHPDSLRYPLWRARITGDAGKLASRIREEAIETDTRHVRGVIEGLSPLMRNGYCQ